MKQRVRVLIADDRRSSRNGLRALLGVHPEIMVVGEAIDGREAVRLVEELQPDVVLMDVLMPVLDGLEATRLVKENWPGVRVILLTMYALPQTNVMASGADSFLVKGCPTEDLVEAISEGLPKAPSGHRESRRRTEEGTGGSVLPHLGALYSVGS